MMVIFFWLFFFVTSNAVCQQVLSRSPFCLSLVVGNPILEANQRRDLPKQNSTQVPFLLALGQPVLIKKKACHLATYISSIRTWKIFFTMQLQTQRHNSLQNIITVRCPGSCLRLFLTLFLRWPIKCGNLERSRERQRTMFYPICHHV